MAKTTRNSEAIKIALSHNLELEQADDVIIKSKKRLMTSESSKFAL